MFAVEKFLQDHSIDYCSSGNKHCRGGWVQIHCPFCPGARDYHLGIHLSLGYGSCWRCRGKSMLLIIKTLLNCSWGQAKLILGEYGGSSLIGIAGREHKVHSTIRDIEVQWPWGAEALSNRHREYLADVRKIDPDWVERVYGLRGCGAIGDYKHRIIAPIHLDGKMISYQGRDITGKSPLKYKACAQIDEAMDHKCSLYAVDLVPGNSVVVVEGVVDAWRLGPGAVATFGIAFRTEQMHMLMARFDNIYLLFDGEARAQLSASPLARNLAATGRKVEIIELSEGDPGEMSQSQADDLMDELGL